MEYRVIDSLPFANGKPVIPWADRTTKEGDLGFYIAYQFGKPSITLAVVWHDEDTDSWLVGAEPDVLELLPTPQYTLDEVVDSDKGAWSSFRYAEDSGLNRHGIGKGWQLGGVPPGVWTALQTGAPLPAQYLPFDIDGECVGLKPEPFYSLGPFKANEASSIWYGDDLGIPVTASVDALEFDVRVR